MYLYTSWLFFFFLNQFVLSFPLKHSSAGCTPARSACLHLGEFFICPENYRAYYKEMQCCEPILMILFTYPEDSWSSWVVWLSMAFLFTLPVISRATAVCITASPLLSQVSWSFSPKCRSSLWPVTAHARALRGYARRGLTYDWTRKLLMQSAVEHSPLKGLV